MFILFTHCRLLHNELSSTDVVNESTITESQLNSFQTLTRNVEHDRSAHFTVPQSRTCIGAVHSSHSLNGRQTPLLFSHLEHTHSTHVSKSTSTVTDSTVLCCNCRHLLEAASLHREAGSICPNCGERLTVAASSSNHTDEDIVTSFNSLSVSSASASSSSEVSLASSSAPRAACSHMSCRQQAVTYAPSYFDDTTVDDLAGYLDEIMFLPKPMSEMAELMYT